MIMEGRGTHIYFPTFIVLGEILSDLNSSDGWEKRSDTPCPPPFRVRKLRAGRRVWLLVAHLRSAWGTCVCTYLSKFDWPELDEFLFFLSSREYTHQMLQFRDDKLRVQQQLNAHYFQGSPAACAGLDS